MNDLKRDDLAHIWHPCSQMKDYVEHNVPMIPIERGEGAYLFDYEGRRYLDAISSWWVNLFGHTNGYIAEAIGRQSSKLEHVIFAGFTHEQAVRLASRITSVAPRGLNRVFFADNGSSAVEVAIKMAFHAKLNQGLKRPLIVSLQNSYHGETLGALAAGDVDLYKQTYMPLLFRTIQAKSPALCDEDEALDDMRRVLSHNRDQVCAVIVEPLVQCAGNMAMFNPSYLGALRRLCDEFDVYLIADEIAVGFGRTGTLFACEQAGISPDLMTLSKGLTGGFLPLALTLASDEIYDAFYDDYEKGKSFLHSHSYTANPIACAAANASLDLLSDGVALRENQAKSALIGDRLSAIADLKRVKNTRWRGMIAAFEVEGFKPNERIGVTIAKEALKRGVLLRPLGNTVYFMPPYIITNEEIDNLFAITAEIVKAL
ncbi:MAG: adenosylmethionine--8-amino-7-oxononanoate transaminase [Helicobacteraceae bacterium]|jgi:adenosylmethionine-8-amino-7-oxononanoate aminotransferase|nr:adenosylmethionine--8-amino-7-oxononanoate transaminase [Helicobacteraceae bacterium]